MFKLDLTSRHPIYEQLYNNVIKLINTEVLKPNDPLPTIRTLAMQLSINPNTVSKAYKNLENDGYICSLIGRGSFVSPNLKVDDSKKLNAIEILKKSIEQAKLLGVLYDEIINVLKIYY